MISRRERKSWKSHVHPCVENFKYFWDFGKYFDVSFKVEKDDEKGIYEAHKLILSLSSDVFEAMMYGNLSEGKEILITDIHPSVFEQLLSYIYKSTVELNSYENATELYYAAEKYMLTDLKRLCANHIKYILHPTIALQAYEFAVFYKNRSLRKKVLEYSVAQVKDIIKQDSFCSAKPSTIYAIFNQNKLNIDKETLLLNAIERYAEFHNIKIQYNPDVEDRTGINQMLTTIRYINMSEEEFIESEAIKKFFNNDQQDAMLYWIVVQKLHNFYLKEFIDQIPKMPKGLLPYYLKREKPKEILSDLSD